MKNPLEQFIEAAQECDEKFSPIVFTNMVLNLQFLKKDYLDVLALAKENELPLLPALKFIIEENNCQLAHLNSMTLMNQFADSKQSDDDWLFLIKLKCSFLKNKQVKLNYLTRLDLLKRVKNKEKRLDSGFELIGKLVHMNNEYYSQNKLYDIWIGLGGEDERVLSLLPDAFDSRQSHSISPQEFYCLKIQCDKASYEHVIPPNKYVNFLEVFIEHFLNDGALFTKHDKKDNEYFIYFEAKKDADKYIAKINFYMERMQSKVTHMSSYEMHDIFDEFEAKFEEIYHLEQILPVNDIKAKSVKL